MPMLLDFTSTSHVASGPYPCTSVIVPAIGRLIVASRGCAISSLGRLMPLAAPGPTMNGLIVDPGSYGSVRLLIAGEAHCSPSPDSFGSNVGQLASAARRRCFGSITTTSPFFA